MLISCSTVISIHIVGEQSESSPDQVAIKVNSSIKVY